MYAMFGRLKKWRNSFRLSLKQKMVLALSAIAVVLVVSGIISYVEYRRMSNYVSDMIAEDINSINVAQKLAAATDDYNLHEFAAGFRPAGFRLQVRFPALFLLR